MALWRVNIVVGGCVHRFSGCIQCTVYRSYRYRCSTQVVGVCPKVPRTTNMLDARPVVHEASHTYIPSTLQGTGSTHIHVMCTQLQHYSTEHSSTSIVKSQLVKT